MARGWSSFFIFQNIFFHHFETYHIYKTKQSIHKIQKHVLVHIVLVGNMLPTVCERVYFEIINQHVSCLYFVTINVIFIRYEQPNVLLRVFF